MREEGKMSDRKLTFRTSVKQWGGTHRVDLLVISLYAILAVLVTFPTAFRLRSAVFGMYSDAPYYLWLTWWRKFSLLHGLDFTFQSYSQAPFGAEQISPGFSGLTMALAMLAIPFGEIAAYNLMILLAYFLSGVTAYYVIRQFGFGKSVSFVAGLVFAFSCYALKSNLHHVDIAQHWTLPLFVLALLNLRQKKTVFSAILVGGAFALAGYMHPYYGYYAFIIALAFVSVELVMMARSGELRVCRRVGLYLLAGVVGIIIYMPDLFSSIAALSGDTQSSIRSANMLSQPASLFFWYSSRPWDFVIPPTDHFVFGNLAERFRAWVSGIGRLDFSPPILERLVPGLYMRWYWQSMGGADQQYLGIINLIVAGYALRQPHSSSAPNESSSIHDRRRFGKAFALTLFVAGFLFSQPPLLPVGAVLRPLWEPLHNVVIPMPTLLTMHFASPFRIAIRTVTLMMLALAILTAYGLERLRDRIQKPVLKTAVLVAFAGILAFEYSYSPITTPLPIPQEITWMAEQPSETTIAHYPFYDNHSAAMQRVHELPIVNVVSRSHTPLDNIAYIENVSIGSLDAPAIGPKLAALGVRYVINAGDRLAAPPDGLLPAFTTDTAEVFEVVAEPAPLVVLGTLRDGLWVSEADWAWQDSEYLIYIWNPFPGAVEVTITLDSPEDVGDTAMMATRTLTPHPRTIYDGGTQIPNPYIPPDYPDESILSEPAASGPIFRSMLIQPGETILNLRWSDNEEEAYPAITNIHFVVAEVEGP